MPDPNTATYLERLLTFLRTAAGTSYDPTESGLTATNVQAAIDEVGSGEVTVSRACSFALGVPENTTWSAANQKLFVLSGGGITNPDGFSTHVNPEDVEATEPTLVQVPIAGRYEIIYAASVTGVTGAPLPLSTPPGSALYVGDVSSSTQLGQDYATATTEDTADTWYRTGFPQLWDISDPETEMVYVVSDNFCTAMNGRLTVKWLGPIPE